MKNNSSQEQLGNKTLIVIDEDKSSSISMPSLSNNEPSVVKEDSESKIQYSEDESSEDDETVLKTPTVKTSSRLAKKQSSQHVSNQSSRPKLNLDQITPEELHEESLLSNHARRQSKAKVAPAEELSREEKYKEWIVEAENEILKKVEKAIELDEIPDAAML